MQSREQEDKPQTKRKYQTCMIKDFYPKHTKNEKFSKKINKLIKK